MQDGDARKIEDALVAFTAALEAVRGVGAWHATPETKDRIRAIIARINSDQKLARLLADIAQQKLDFLAGATPQAIAPNTYSRKG